MARKEIFFCSLTGQAKCCWPFLHAAKTA